MFNIYSKLFNFASIFYQINLANAYYHFWKIINFKYRRNDHKGLICHVYVCRCICVWTNVISCALSNRVAEFGSRWPWVSVFIFISLARLRIKITTIIRHHNNITTMGPTALNIPESSTPAGSLTLSSCPSLCFFIYLLFLHPHPLSLPYYLPIISLARLRKKFLIILYFSSSSKNHTLLSRAFSFLVSQQE